MANRRNAFQANIANGFADDCDELLFRCLQRKPVTFQNFCYIWKDMGIANIFFGRTMGTEIAELSEEVIHVAKRYLTADTSNFEEVVASLFLVYALLNLQPYPRFGYLRLTADDMGALNWIEAVARRQCRYDVLYALGAVLVKGTHFHAENRERGMDKALAKYLDGCTGMDGFGVRPKGVFLRQNEEIDVIRELSTLTLHYADTKAVMSTSDTDQGMNYIDSKWPEELNTSLKKLVNGMFNEEEPKPDPAASIQSIKERAMKTAVPGMSHLISVEERKSKRLSQNAPQTSPSPVKASPKKRSPRKKFGIGKISPRKRGKRKRKDSVTSSSNSDGNLSLASDPEAEAKEAESKQTEQKSLPADIEIEIPPKSPIASTSSEGSKVLCEGTAENEEINIQIDSLPILIRADKDKFIEIEIIDKLKEGALAKEKAVPKRLRKKTSVAQAREKIRELDDVSIRKIDPVHQLGECSSVYTGMARISKLGNVEVGECSEVPQQIRKHVKSRTKSKFKKMGILPVVANVKESE